MEPLVQWLLLKMVERFRRFTVERRRPVSSRRTGHAGQGQLMAGPCRWPAAGSGQSNPIRASGQRLDGDSGCGFMVD